MKTLMIEKDAIRNNAAVIKEKAGSAAIYAVLTGDAHGAGLVEMARLLRSEGIGRFCISEPAEAETLRKAGFVDEEILMLRSTTDRDELEKLIDLGVVCTIGSYDTGVALNGLCEARSTVAEAHIQVDTGMGYGGFLADEPDKILSMYRYLPNVALSGIYTQMHCGGGGEREVSEQLKVFESVVAAVNAAGFETGVTHAAGSDALMHYEFARLGAVRVGSAFLGRCRRTRGDGLQKAGYCAVTLDEVRWLPKGHTVGHHTLVRMKKPTRVGVLPVGYQNGFGAERPRESGLAALLRAWWGSRRRTVRIGDQKVRVIGQIGAFETLVDVTDLKCTAGDTAIVELDPLYAKGMKREYR
ncbi:MAG: alanine racemase [Clostridia bacterium]|nr:alanine racemase [Clostridia bacterium]